MDGDQLQEELVPLKSRGQPLAGAAWGQIETNLASIHAAKGWHYPKSNGYK